MGTARGDDYLQVKKAVWPKGNELIGLKEWIKTKDVPKPGKSFWVPSIGKGESGRLTEAGTFRAGLPGSPAQINRSL